MKKLIGICHVIVLLLASMVCTVHAEEPASRDSVETLLEITEVANMTEAMYGQIESMFGTMAQQLQISEERQPKFEDYMAKLSELLRNDMGFEQIKEPIVEVYTKHFSEEDIQGLIEFYGTDLGQKTVKKMPMVMSDSMLVAQRLMQDVMPKVQALAEEMQAELKGQ